jgi:hypothetical protein
VDGSIVWGSRADASYGCDDEGGAGLVDCIGTVPDGSSLDTTPGVHRFEVVASDGAGNQATSAASYMAVRHAAGSIADGAGKAGTPATLILGVGLERPLRRLAIAPGFPRVQQVDCLDHAATIGPSAPAQALVISVPSTVVTVWRTSRSWTGTCQALTFRFTTDGWTGMDPSFVVDFR